MEFGAEGLHGRDFVGQQPGRGAPMALEQQDVWEEGVGDIADIDMADVLSQDDGRAEGGDGGGTLGARKA